MKVRICITPGCHDLTGCTALPLCSRCATVFQMHLITGQVNADFRKLRMEKNKMKSTALTAAINCLELNPTTRKIAHEKIKAFADGFDFMLGEVNGSPAQIIGDLLAPWSKMDENSHQHITLKNGRTFCGVKITDHWTTSENKLISDFYKLDNGCARCRRSFMRRRNSIVHHWKRT